MQRFMLSLSAITFSFCLGLSAWVYFHRPHAANEKLLSGPPCRDGLITAVAQPGLPIHVELLETACEKSETASVRFIVRNTGDRSVRYFRVRAIYTYDNYVDDGSEFGTGSLAPGQEITGAIGHGVSTLAGRRPAGHLRDVKVMASMYEYDDGSGWRRPFLADDELKR